MEKRKDALWIACDESWKGGLAAHPALYWDTPTLIAALAASEANIGRDVDRRYVFDSRPR